MLTRRVSEVVDITTTTTGVDNSDQFGTSQQVSRNVAGSGPLKLPKLLAVLPTSSVQSNPSPDGCRNNQKQEKVFICFLAELPGHEDCHRGEDKEKQPVPTGPESEDRRDDRRTKSDL